MSEIGAFTYILDLAIKSCKLFFYFGFVIFPSLGFVAQYFKIRSLKNSQGFSKFISFSLIIAYIVRIYFWLGKKFQVILLLQSIFGIFVQLILVEICVRFSKKEIVTNKYHIYKNNETNQTNNININNDKINFSSIDIENMNNSKYDSFFSLKNFWNWNIFADYVNFIFIFVIYLGILTHLFEENYPFYFEILGSISAFSEAIIGFPQIIENYRYKSTKTLSSLLILTWITGDSIKLIYFLLIDTPIQLIICAVTQIIQDIVIISQIFYYKRII